MAYPNDFGNVFLRRAIDGRQTESLQGDPDAVNQYLSSPNSSVHFVPFVDNLLLQQYPYHVVNSSASYPTSPEQHRYTSSDSSVVSSNDMSGAVGTSMLLEASEGWFCFEPAEHNTAIAHTMPEYASIPPEFMNLDMSPGYIALERQNESFDFGILSNMSWDQRESGIPASHSEIDHDRSPTNIPVNTSQPPTQDEQKHVCDELECGGKPFTRSSDLKRHKYEQHNPEKVNYICGCCNNKQNAPSFKRMEKLMDHKNKFHGYVKGAKLLHCLEDSCLAESTRVLCFCAEDGLKHHMSQAHQFKAPYLQDRLHETDPLEKTKAVSSLETSSKGQGGDPNHLSLFSSAKRATDAEQEFGAKRFRDQHDGIPKMMDVVPASKSALDFYTSPRFELQGQSAGLYCIELLVRNVWPSDFFNLAQFIRSAEAEMKISQAFKSEAPLISFNLPQRWIKLRGLAKITSAFKARLEAFLENKRNAEPSQNIRNNQESVLCLRTRFGHTMQRPANGPKLFPVRSKEDLPLLDTWHRTILPSLPGILQDAIGDNYLASMVRKGSSKQFCRAVIQIQMPKMPSAVVQNEIRSQILSLLDANLARHNTTVEFSAGSLKLLAAEDVLEIDVDGSDAVSSTCEVAPEGYPHFKRYWSRPGMGASVGLRCSENVSATLGCYIHVDDKLYLLTVEHLVRKSRNGLTEGIGDQNTLLSPAPSEIEEMKTTMDQFLRDIECEISAQWKETHGDAESVLADLDQTPEAIEELLENHRFARQHRSELDLGVKCFELGRVVYLSDSTERSPSCAEVARISASTAQERPHMDWALCDVITERAGMNQHRYQVDDETGQVDFWSGDVENLGAGQPCEDTGTVEADDNVHFVGQTTGRRCGTINAAKMLISCRTSKSYEWTLVPATDEQMNSKGKGDSGASIIRDHDNKLVGHLWARAENGLWVFTAIESVFQDISRKLDAKDVRLAPIGKRGRSSPLAVADAEIANEVEEICRDRKDEAHVLKTYSIASMKLPKKQKQPARLGPESNAANAGLPSPPKTPAAPAAQAAPAAPAAPASNKPKAQEPMIPPLVPPQAPTFTIILPNMTWHDKLNVQAKCFSTAEADKLLSLVYISRNWPHKKTARQSTFPHRRQPLLIRSANTWPVTQSDLQHSRSSLKAQRPIVAN